MSRGLLAHAVDADVAGFDQRSSRGARLHHPRVPQPFIETLALQISSPSDRSLFLAAGELFLQRCQFGERRIRIGRTVAIARRGRGGPLTVRRAAVALVAAALVTSAEVAALVARATVAAALVAVATLVAIAAAEFPVGTITTALVPVAPLAFEARTLVTGL